jgi:hypothetical protein
MWWSDTRQRPSLASWGVLDDEACDYFAQIVLNCSNGCLHALQ